MSPSITNATEMPPSEQRITAWLLDYLSRLTDIAPEHLNADLDFGSLGLDSYQGIVMSSELEAWLGRRIDLSAAFAHPTPRLFAAHLAGQAGSLPPV
jgi:acyl carrier protein